tara:strand:- start:735 stop:2057 length:1323 start_codon:yes stop_codon:yes gene_type:complete
MSDITLWEPSSTDVLPIEANTPTEIAEYAVQLNSKDKTQIAFALDNGFFEMGMNYLWSKTEQALKNELSSVGITFIGEMLGKIDVSEDDDINDIVTTRDSIRLAEELGMITPTDGMRLRQSHEIIVHFSQLSTQEGELQNIDREEAVLSLKTCVRAVLGKPNIPVAKKFVEFRESLENVTLTALDPQVAMLKSSPYFYYKLTISVLMNAAKKAQGATLEHSLANINLLIPILWANLRDLEKRHVGHTYAETYSEGKNSSMSGLKKALLKVKGFDYVPENLRSDSFVKAADEVIKAHEGMNNFHNEYAAVKGLINLGTTIPVPALSSCLTALICVYLGNPYGTSHTAWPIAENSLNQLTPDRWEYYLNHVLPSDLKVLDKLQSGKTRDNWINNIVKKYSLSQLVIKNKTVGDLIRASDKDNFKLVISHTKTLLKEYYGKTV